MKTKHFIIVLAFLIFSSCCMHRRNHSHTTYSQPVESYSEPIPPPVNFQTFYDDLSPYGYWIYNENGYVWIPEYGPNFSPYHTNGHWVFTNYGWTWVSQYNWGWAPFHYGRWIWDDIYGWEWIPGYDWAPAWVYWGQYNNYYGWAPMPPNAGYGYQPPMNQWCFVPQQNINQVNIVNNNTTIINNNTTVNNITIINNTNTYNNQIYQSGPKKEDVEKVTGLKVPEVVVNDVKSSKDVKADGNIITIYRPSIDKGSSTVKPAPKKVETLENIKPIKDRPVTTTTKDKKTEVATAKEKTTTISKDNEVAPVKEKTNTISKYNETAPTKAPNTNIPKSNEVSPAVKEKTKTNSKENEVAPAKTNISKDKDKQVAPVKVKNAANIKNTKESTLKEKTTKSNKKLKKD